MTAPPGGPYGQDPYGQNPYGQDPYGQNPYGQDPAWGNQPPPGQQPPADPYAETQYYQTPPPAGQYPPPGGYPSYPPGGQYPGYPPGSPYPTGPSGPVGPPPRKSRTPWVIGAIAAVLVVAILAVAVIFALRGDDTTNTATPSLITSSPVSQPPLTPSTASSTPSTSPSTSAPASGEQTATDCTENVSGGSLTGSMAQAGQLGFPLSAAPGWAPAADATLPNAIDVVGVIREVADAEDWMMEAMVGVTNFVPSMSLADQASKLLTCVADGPGFAGASPTLGTPTKSAIKVDGVEAERVEAEVTIADTTRGIPGDNLVIITVKTDPVTFFVATTPIGDSDSHDQVQKIIDALKVSGR
ncbi:hypothetical protein ABQE69_00800 [Mycolicibacillus trivialis]